MALSRWFTPFASMVPYTPRFELDDFLNSGVSVRYNDGKKFVDFTLAGVPKENIDIDVRDGVVEITSKYDNDTNYRYYEYRYSIPRGTNLDEITAEYNNGILTLCIPQASGGNSRKITLA